MYILHAKDSEHYKFHPKPNNKYYSQTFNPTEAHTSQKWWQNPHSLMESVHVRSV